MYLITFSALATSPDASIHARRGLPGVASMYGPLTCTACPLASVTPIMRPGGLLASVPFPTTAPLPTVAPLPTTAPLPSAEPLPTVAPLPTIAPLPIVAPLATVALFPMVEPLPTHAPLP